MEKYILLILISILTLSCNSNKTELSENPINDYSEYINTNSISSDIEFMPEELYENSTETQSPTLQLRFATTEIFTCVNYSIVTTKFVRENELIIRFDELLEPSVCLNAFGPAISYINLPENINKLTLINGEIIDTYSIEINNQQVIISVIENNFTNSLYNRTFRYPENTFAYVCGTNIDNTNLYDDFSNILINNPSFMAYEFEGEGRIPYPKNSSGHWVNNPSLYFKYNNKTDFDALEQLLNNFTTENIRPNSGVSISLISWDNRRSYSWIH